MFNFYLKVFNFVNSNIKSSVKAVFSDWRDKKDDNSDGKHPYQISQIIGFSSDLAPGNNVLQSAHTFGIAITLVPTPVDPDLIAIFKAHGFGWGGDFSGGSQPGYFSKLHDEGGSGDDQYYRKTK